MTCVLAKSHHERKKVHKKKKFSPARNLVLILLTDGFCAIALSERIVCESVWNLSKFFFYAVLPLLWIIRVILYYITIMSLCSGLLIISPSFDTRVLLNQTCNLSFQITKFFIRKKSPKKEKNPDETRF